MINRHLYPGVVLALASAALFGASTPLAKLLLGAIDPWMLAGLLYLGAGGGLAVIHLVSRFVGRVAVEAPLRRSDLPRLFAVVLTGGVAGPALLMLGLARTGAAEASLLLNVEGLATLGIAWLAFRENVDERLLLGAFAILFGAALVSWQGADIAFQPGALLIVAACIAWGLDNNLTRKLSSADPIQITLIKGLVAGSVNLGIALLQGSSIPFGASLGLALVLGFFGYGVSLVLFVLGLRHLGAARAGAYFALAPFIGALIAIMLLGESFSFTLGAAAAFMSFGLWAHLSERHNHDHDHEGLEHEHRHVHDEHHQHEHDSPAEEPHTHRHRHAPLVHGHAHYPDLHHRHSHRNNKIA